VDVIFSFVYSTVFNMVVFRLSPCLECSLCSFGNFHRPGRWNWHWVPKRRAFILQTPGQFPKEHRLFLAYFQKLS